MNRADWLIVFSRCTTMYELETLINKRFWLLSDDELEHFNSAADHRRAELTMGRLFDKVPPAVWRHIK